MIQQSRAAQIVEKVKGKERMSTYERLLKRLMRSTRDTTVTLRVPGWLRDRIQKQAVKEGATISNLLTDWALMGITLSEEEKEIIEALNQ